MMMILILIIIIIIIVIVISLSTHYKFTIKFNKYVEHDRPGELSPAE